MTDDLTPAEAGRIVLAAQGLGARRPRAPGGVVRGAAPVRRVLARLGPFQIDSVSTVVRAHYLPAFSRLGPYDRALIDRDAWGPPGARRQFEYWGHMASLLPLASHPLFRWRMARADAGEGTWGRMRVFARERRAEAMALLARIRDEGPVAASDLSRGHTGWWAWSEPKTMLEWLFAAGHLTTRTRRASFERVYDLPERVLPASVLALPTPSPFEARRTLLAEAARALGVATAAELRDYHRLRPEDAAAPLAALREEGILVPVRVPGWPASFRHRDATPGPRPRAAALLAPFDPLVWERARTRRLFGFDYRIEIDVPEALRRHGYDVLPFLLGDRLVARVDLKADRAARRLRVQGLHLEPHAPPDTPDALSASLAELAVWLGLDGVVTKPAASRPPAPRGEGLRS